MQLVLAPVLGCDSCLRLLRARREEPGYRQTHNLLIRVEIKAASKKAADRIKSALQSDFFPQHLADMMKMNGRGAFKLSAEQV